MNARCHSTSDLKSLIANTSRSQRLLAVALVAAAIMCFAVAEFAFAQGLPDQVISDNALGNSPFADQLSGEDPVAVTGVLTVLHSDDFANKRSENFYYLKDSKTKETYKLRFNKKAPGHLRSGATVKARGRAKGRELYLALDQTGKESIETILPAAVTVSGEQRTIVMVLDLLDSSVSCSFDSIQNLMFTDPADNSIDDFYQEASFGEVWFSGEVVGPYTINYTSTGTCSPSSWAAATDAAAQAEGVNLGSYDRKIYVLPRNNPCVGDGLGTVGGNPSRSWILKCDRIDVYGHELGHNLGMHHASTPDNEYGDYSDVMGLRLHQVNAPHKEQMGWLPPEQVPTVNKDGFYDIDSLETNPWEAMAPQALKIAKPDTDEYYYLSYRQSLGFDATLSSFYLGGLNVHRYKGSGAVQTYFLDKLLDGESFVDAVNGITITQISHSDVSVTIQVQMDGTCVTSTPAADISPASQSAAAGTTLDYTVTVTNTDSRNCAASSFALGVSLPEGWAGSFSPNTLTLSPGQTDTATLSVISPEGAATASYGFTVNVSGADAIGASYIVEGINEVDTEVPTAPGGLKARLKGKNVKLNWTAATDNVGVSGYAVWRDGARIGDTTGTSYLDSSAPDGMTCTYTVSAYDAAGNRSATSNTASVTLRSVSSKGGGKGKNK